MRVSFFSSLPLLTVKHRGKTVPSRCFGASPSSLTLSVKRLRQAESLHSENVLHRQPAISDRYALSKLFDVRFVILEGAKSSSAVDSHEKGKIDLFCPKAGSREACKGFFRRVCRAQGDSGTLRKTPSCASLQAGILLFGNPPGRAQREADVVCGHPHGQELRQLPPDAGLHECGDAKAHPTRAEETHAGKGLLQFQRSRP